MLLGKRVGIVVAQLMQYHSCGITTVPSLMFKNIRSRFHLCQQFGILQCFRSGNVRQSFVVFHLTRSHKGRMFRFVTVKFIYLAMIENVVRSDGRIVYRLLFPCHHKQPTSLIWFMKEDNPHVLIGLDALMITSHPIALRTRIVYLNAVYHRVAILGIMIVNLTGFIHILAKTAKERI